MSSGKTILITGTYGTYQDADCQHDLSPLMLPLVTWLRQCWSDFSTVNVTPFPSPPFPSLTLGGSHYDLLTLSGELCSRPFKGRVAT